MIEVHPIAMRIPEMPPDQYDRLKADIKKNGLREPITLYGGKVLDGRHRDRACNETGVLPRYKDWDCKGDVVDFVKSMNLSRRHLTISQLSMIGVDLLPICEEQAAERMNAGGVAPACAKGKAAEHAAKAVGVSTRSIETAKKVNGEASPKVRESVRSGKMSLNAAAKTIKAPKKPKPCNASQVEEAYRKLVRIFDDFAEATKTQHGPGHKHTMNYLSKVWETFEKWKLER